MQLELDRTFAEQRADLLALAARMLGSAADAQDAVQETWLRMARTADAVLVENPAGWLRTVLTRICLDVLRGRTARREVLGSAVPDVVRRADPSTLPPGAAPVVHGAWQVAEGAVLLAHRAADAAVALVDGAPGLVVAPHGRQVIALTFTVRDGLIEAYDVIADPARLALVDLAVLP